MKAHFFPGIATAVLAAALLAATAAAQAGIIPAAELRGKRILLVTGQPDPDRPADDAAVKAHLESLGCVVTGALDSDPASRSQGQDLVVISASVNAHVLQGTYRDSALPVFTWSGESYPNLAMTGPRRHVDFEIVDTKIFYAQSFTNLYGLCVNATNPIARDVGLPAQLFGTLYLEPEETCWGRPGFGAQVVSVFEGDPDKAGLFTYEQGATLADGSAAPARRVGFFLGRDNFHMLTDCHGPAERDPDEKAWYVGLKLFDASLRWALSPPPPPPGSDHAELHAQLARAARGKKVLFVERIESPEGKEADEHDVAYLRALGFTVTVADQTDLARPAGQDLIVISATCSKYKLTNKYSDAGIPIMCHEGLYGAPPLHRIWRARRGQGKRRPRGKLPGHRRGVASAGRGTPLRARPDEQDPGHAEVGAADARGDCDRDAAQRPGTVRDFWL